MSTRRAASASASSLPRRTAIRTSAMRARTNTKAACKPAFPKTAAAQEMGGDQDEDRGLRSGARGARRQGTSAGRRPRSSAQSLDRGARRPDGRACRPVRADTGDRENPSRSDRPDEILRAHPDHSDADAGGAQVGQSARHQDLRRAHHEVPAQQQHLHLRQDRPGEKIRHFPRNPRCDVAVQRQVRQALARFNDIKNGQKL